MSDICSSLLFPTPGRRWELGVLSWSHDTLLGESALQMSAMNFPTDFFVTGFALGCKSLLTCFWISREGN